MWVRVPPSALGDESFVIPRPSFIIFGSVKNILLLHPWIYDFTACDFWLRPLGLLQIGAIIRQYTDCQVHFIDCLDRFHPGLSRRYPSKPDGRGSFPKEEVSKPEVIQMVPRKFSRYGLPVPLFQEELRKIPTPEAVLVTCGMTYWYPGVQLACELIRKQYGQVPIILGGVYPSLLPEHARRESGVDLIVVGPGENQILPLLREILGDRSVQERKFTRLDELPLPAYDLLRETSSLPLLTSRGCPFRCSFCASHLLYPCFEQKSPAVVLADVELLVKKLNCRHLAFYDDSLLLNNQHHLRPILKGIIEKNFALSLQSPNGLHVREIDQELARLMKQANFSSVYLSQESFDQAWLKEASPKVSAEDLPRAVKNLEQAGFSRSTLNVYLLAGFPGQDWDQMEENVTEVLRLGLRPKLAFFSPIPGTRDWQKIVAEGKLQEDADPLLQNKIAFLYLQGEEIILRLNRIKKLIQADEKFPV